MPSVPLSSASGKHTKKKTVLADYLGRDSAGGGRPPSVGGIVNLHLCGVIQQPQVGNNGIKRVGRNALVLQGEAARVISNAAAVVLGEKHRAIRESARDVFAKHA